jgi:hypothetical protein
MEEVGIDISLVTDDGIRRLLSFLPLLSGQGIQHGTYPNLEKTGNNTYSIIPSKLSVTAASFVAACNEENFVQPFDWCSWSEAHQAEINDDAFILNLDLHGIVMLLTTHIRTDRFCDGHLLSAFESGAIVRILDRLQEISFCKSSLLNLQLTQAQSNNVNSKGEVMNLFWSTRTLTAAREDHLTEFVAAALTESEPFRLAYGDYVLQGIAEVKGSEYPKIQSVATQVSFPGTTCCPDMILTLSDGRQIACEHKLDALEAMGPESDQRAQLKRYLDLPVDGLLYVRTAWKPPVPEVLTSPKYIHPAGREHFLWRDFYPLLSCDSHVLLRWLREGFERLGFTPPHPSVGEMSGPDNEENRANRANVAKLWQSTRSYAHDLGWKVGSGSIVELYLTDNRSSRASCVFISPAQCERFLFRVTPHEGALKSVMDNLAKATGLINKRVEIVQHEVVRKEGKESVVDITTTLREILGAQTLSCEQIEAGLLGFVSPLLRALQS